MKTILAICALMLASTSVMTKPARAERPFGAEKWNSEIAWSDFESVAKTAGKDGKPIMMVFVSEDCAPCEEYRQLFLKPEMVKRSAELNMVLIDVDQRPDLNERFGFMGKYLPRTLFVDANGVFSPELKSDRPIRNYQLSTTNPAEVGGLMQTAVKNSQLIMAMRENPEIATGDLQRPVASAPASTGAVARAPLPLPRRE